MFLNSTVTQTDYVSSNTSQFPVLVTRYNGGLTSRGEVGVLKSLNLFCPLDGLSRFILLPSKVEEVVPHLVSKNSKMIT